MSAESPHLTLRELAAGESTGLLAGAAALHLDTCAACQARGQAVVGDGVRFMVSRCHPPPGLIHRIFAAIDAPPASPHRGWLPGRSRAASSRTTLRRFDRVIPGQGGFRRHALRRPWRLAAAGLAAATAGFLTAQLIAPGGARPTGTIAVHELAYRAAAAAARQPGVRPGQWLYWKEKSAEITMRQLPGGKWAEGSSASTFEVWTTANSQHAAWVYMGKVVSLGKGPFLGQPEPSLLPGRGWTVGSETGKIPVSYAALRSLPLGPRALDRYLGSLHLRGWGPAPLREFQLIEDLLTTYVMPPGLTAELYRALASVPGVTADAHATDLAGRPGVAFRITQPPAMGGAVEEIIINPRTFRLMGTVLVGARARDRGHVLAGTAILRMALVSGPGILP